MSAKLCIFVSSVQKELGEERRALKAFVADNPLLGRFFEVFLFEDIPASDRSVDDVYLEQVDRCALYVGLFGDSYGTPGSDNLSPTEREFDRATAAAKPRLIFVKGSNDNDRHPRMRALMEKAGDQLVRRRFFDIGDLIAGLYASLVEHLCRIGAIQTGPFDAAACRDATLADVSEEKVALFLTKARQARGYALGPGTSMRDVLVHLNLLGAGHPSNAAILLFGTQPQRFLLTSEIKCLHFHGTVIRKPISSYQVYKGDLFQLVDQAVDFVMGKIDRGVGTRAQSNEAPVTYEMPREGVAEAIVNAVAHRDYASNASIQVMLFSDRLEIWNPGELPPLLTIEALRRPHASIPHNPLIAEPLFLARLIERAGTGTLDMIALCAEAGLKPPQFRQDAGSFVQTLWRPHRENPATSRSESRSESRPESRPEWRPEWGRESVHHRVMLSLKKSPASRSEIVRILGHKSVSNALRHALADLMKAGFVKYTIPEKPNSRLQRYMALKPAINQTNQTPLKRAKKPPIPPLPVKAGKKSSGIRIKKKKAGL